MSNNQSLQDWLQQHLHEDFSMQALSGDAGMRNYFRVQCSTNSFIAVDASHPHESSEKFASVANAYREKGLHVPKIFALDNEY